MVRNTFAENPLREIEKCGRYWCPKGRDDAWRKYFARAIDMNPAINRCEHKRLVVQAGGNIGAWPVYLSQKFDEVITFEPETMNFQCLKRNVEQFPNIEAYNMALGDVACEVELKLAKSLGGHHLTRKPGSTPVVTLDSFLLDDLDYLMLDIEGWEYEALLGARESIEKFHPVIQIENRGHGVKKGTGKALKDILSILPGYKQTITVHRDVVLEYMP